MAFRLRADDDGWQLTDPARGPRLSDSTVRVQPYRGKSACTGRSLESAA